MPTLVENRESSSGVSLAVRLREGSPEAWRELVELYGPLVDGWLSRTGTSPAAREDLVQEVFLIVHRSIDTFDPARRDATFRGWLWRIARNILWQHLRSRDPRGVGGSTALQQLANVPDLGEGLPECEPPSDAGETALLLRRAMEQIKRKVDARTWQAFWRTTVLGESTDAVAESLDMTPAAVRKAKSRTLQRLRQQLGDRE